MKEGKLYIKDTANFLDKLKDLGQIPGGAPQVTTDVFGQYPSVSDADDLKVLWKHYNKFLHKKVNTEDIVKMVDCISKVFFFQFKVACRAPTWKKKKHFV